MSQVLGVFLAYRANPKDGIAWVTGASSGIGRAVAIELARRGYRVAATARRAAELETLVRLSNGSIHGFVGDVTECHQTSVLVASIEAELGPISLAFLNAGVAHLGAERAAFTTQTIAETFESNVLGTANCLAPLLSVMQGRGSGQIAITASLAGYAGLPGSSGYGPSKAALINMAEALKLTYEPFGLTIQVVCPGFVRTPMTDQEKKFTMPFIMEAGAAAQRICDGFERKGFEIAFPWQLVYSLKLLRFLPYSVRFWLIDRILGKAERGGTARTPSDVD